MTRTRQLRNVVSTVLGCLLILSSAPALAAGGEQARDYFTDLPLVTHEGEEVHFYSDVLQDRVVLIGGFFMNCTGICPLQMRVLSDLQVLLKERLGDRLGKDLWIVSITLDPDRDTLKNLKGYAERYNKGPGWLFLTGKKENVDWVNYKLGQYAEDVEKHTAFLMLGNLTTGQWIKIQPQVQAKELFELLQQQLPETHVATSG